MSAPIEFLSPRLVGRRFDGGAIPLEVLKDLAVLEEMLIEVAKWGYLKDNPSRKRSPRGFTDSVSLKLTGVDEGSAIPTIALVVASATFFPPQQTYLEHARDRVLRAIDAAQHDEPITPHLPDSLLGYFDRVGRSLREGEAIEFNPGNPTNPSRLDRGTRRKLLLAAAHVQELTDEVQIRGFIPEADQQRNTFTLQAIDGLRISAPIESQHVSEIMEAFNGYRSGAKVLVQGVGSYNRANRLQKIATVEHVSMLDPNDIPTRLDELRGLRAGWLEGGGNALPTEGLDWLAQMFETNFPDHLPLPYLYPTAEGGVQAEWSLPPVEISLDISLEFRTAEWHYLNLNSDECSEESFNLSEHDAWAQISSRLEDLGGGSQQ